MSATATVFAIIIGAFFPLHVDDRIARLVGFNFDVITGRRGWCTVSNHLGIYILGTLLESIAMLVLTISEVVPIAMGLNWDLIWFGIIVVVVLETGMISPPVINVFIVKSIAPEFRWVRFFAGFGRFGLRWH